MKKAMMFLIFVTLVLIPGCEWGSSDVEVNVLTNPDIEKMERAIEAYNQELDE